MRLQRIRHGPFGRQRLHGQTNPIELSNSDVRIRGQRVARRETRAERDGN
jgi:hypothetical protein